MKSPFTIIVVVIFLWIAPTAAVVAQGAFHQDQMVTDFIIDKAEYLSYNFSGGLLSQPYLFSDLDFSSYELIAANVNFSDMNSTQKITFSPLRLIKTRFPLQSIARGAKINIAQRDGVTTVGISLGGDTSSPFSRAWNSTVKNISFPSPPTIPPGSFADFSKQLSEYQRGLARHIIEFDKERLKHVFRFSVGYNVQLFSVFGAKGTTSDFDSLNAHSVKSNTLTGSFTYSCGNGLLELSGNYNLIFLRKNAAEGSTKESYTGPAFAIKGRLLTLTDQKELEKSKAYVRTHFIPSIDVGIAFEGKYFQGNDITQAENDTKTVEAYTFFVDFRVSPAAQFRLGIPRTKMIKADNSEESGFGALLQYSFKIVNLE